MRTLHFTKILIACMILSLFTVIKAHGQKSTYYNSVGTKLEEIAIFLEGDNSSCEIINSTIINCMQFKTKAEFKSEELVENLSRRSEFHVDKMNDTISKNKVSLSKHPLATAKSKHLTNINKELSQTPPK